MGSIRTAIFGVGNCASSLVQGRFYYSDRKANVPGLITKNLGGYYAADIEYVAAFDIDRRKVGVRSLQGYFFSPQLHDHLPVQNPQYEMCRGAGVYHRLYRGAQSGL
jgi:myo-inositol-1-phosphate synthase